MLIVKKKRIAQEIVPSQIKRPNKVRFCFGYGSLLVKGFFVGRRYGVSSLYSPPCCRKWVIYINQMFKKCRDLNVLKSKGGVLKRN